MAKVGPEASYATTNDSVTLLKEETFAHAYTGAVTTLTFFTGPAPVEVLRERVAKVVAANPWLAGCLVRGKREKRMRLTFDPAGPLCQDARYCVDGTAADPCDPLLFW